MQHNNSDDFKEWSKWLIKSIEDLMEDIKLLVSKEDFKEFKTKIESKVDNINKEVVNSTICLNNLKKDLQYRSSIWGFIAGAIPAAIALIWAYIKASSKL
jgi:hypothetical protein